MDWSHLYPLPTFDVDNLAPVREIDNSFLQFYGINFSDNIDIHFGKIDLNHFEIACYLFKPQDPIATLIVLNGLYDHVGLFAHPIQWAIDNNFAVLSLDWPGQGLSSGERASIDSFSQFQQILESVLSKTQKALPKPWHLLAQSTGAAIAVNTLANSQSHIHNCQKKIFFAPLVQPYAWQWKKYLHRFSRRWIKSQRRAFRMNTGNRAFLEFVKQDSLSPRRLKMKWVNAMVENMERFELLSPQDDSIVVIQGDCDKTVNWKTNLKLLNKKFRTVDVHLIKGAEHHLVNETVAIRKQWQAVLDKTLLEKS